MKLRRLELEQFRKFERPVQLSGFSDTLNVLCGPNEFGKSTILAAIRGLLFERYSSKAEPVRQMQPLGGKAAPRLAMEFDLQGGRWRIEKRFLQQPWARLTGPAGHSFEGDAAEEELQRLLGFGAAGKKGSTTENLGVWGALWVTQRQSVEQADLSSGLARATVLSCLDSEVGVLTGSERGQSVMRAAREQLAQLIDGNEKPRGRYKYVLASLEDIQRRLDDLGGRARRLSDDSDALLLRTERLAKLNDNVARQKDRDGLEDARRRKQAAMLFERERAAISAAHELAKHVGDEALLESTTRERRRAAMQAQEIAHRDALDASGRARLVASEADQDLAARRNDEAKASARVAQAAETVRRRRAALELAQWGAAHGALTSRLQHVESVQNDIAALAARLDLLGVDKTRIADIRAAAREHDVAHSVLHAQATAIDFDLDASSVGKVTLDGAALTAERRVVSVVAPADISIAGIGRITVLPAIRDIDKLRARATQAAGRLSDLLAACGCLDIRQAEAEWTAREKLETELRDARASLQLLTSGDVHGNLEAGVDALRERVKVLGFRIETGKEQLGLADLPDLDAAGAALKAADDEDFAARACVTQCRAEMDAAGRSSGEARAALVRTESAMQEAQAELARLRREDVEAVQRESDELLAQRLADAETQRASQATLLAKLDRDRVPDTVAAMEARIQRFEQALENRNEAVRKLQLEIAELRARITQEGGAGLDEAIAATERDRERLVQERNVIAREVNILKLLLETLGAAEHETKERYLAPVVQRVTPYLRGLFPDAEIKCDEMLRITGLSRGGTALQEFERLSDGTQEQIAVLARIAFAELLIDQGKPAMLILDDALAYSDDERIERMFDMLARAATRTQILVLTCREDLFGRLGGTRLQLDSIVAAAA